MLDTRGRKYLDNFFKKTSNFFISLNLKPIHITLIALILGVLSSVLYYFNLIILSIVFLWISGYLDAVDGEMARSSKQISKLGTLYDICFDRVVELLFILIFAIKNPNSVFALLSLTICIVLSMTIFLTSGMLLENTSKKSFCYQSGLMERTEGFIMFTLMILFNKYFETITFVYAFLVLFTAGQRFLQATKIINTLENKK